MEDKKHEEPKSARPCPTCGKPSTFADRPFCSRRCADIDLHRWLSGTYGIAAEPTGPLDGRPTEDHDEDG